MLQWIILNVGKSGDAGVICSCGGGHDIKQQ
jgi:hypothetical protein